MLGDASHQRLVDLLKYLAWRKGIQRLSGDLQHAASGGHHQCCGLTIAPETTTCCTEVF
jgi:hypothetical protein